MISRCWLEQEISSVGSHPTSNQLRALQESANKLQRELVKWSTNQNMYMPYAAVLCKKEANAATLEKAGVKVYSIKLWLPSSFNPSDPCKLSLKEYEWCLRYAQAKKALNDIRQAYRLKSHLVKQKKQFIRGVAHNTCANATIQNVQEKANKHAEKYRIAYAALLVLSPQVGKLCPPHWNDHLQPLRDQDLCGISEGLEGESKGKHSISWIWHVEGASGSNKQKTNKGGHTSNSFDML